MSSSSDSWTNPRLAELINEFCDRRRRGELPTVEEYIARYPEKEVEIRRHLAIIELLDLSGGGSEVNQPRLPPKDSTPPPINGYTIVHEIGRGGMGIVYAAREIRLDREVALKILFPNAEGVAIPELLARFQNEATAAGRLHHTHIIPVYTFGQQGNLFYYTMPRIAGQPLSQKISDWHPTIPEGSAARARRSGDWFRRVARIGRDVAEALAHAHRHGITHRDVKPGNILLDVAGEAWLADFGLAHLHDQPRPSDTSGSSPYKAPEQHNGLTNPASDQFGLGVTLYELLSGRLPFPGHNFSRQKQDGDFVPLRKRCPDIPRDLVRIIERTLAPHPSDRYLTAQALADDLGRYHAGYPLERDGRKRMLRLAKWVRRSPLSAGLVLTVALAMIVVPALVIWKQRSEGSLIRQHAHTQLIAVAQAALDRGDMAAAEALFSRALKNEHSEDVTLLVDRARCRFALGRWEKLGPELEGLASRSDLGNFRPTVLLLWGDYLFSFQNQQAQAKQKVLEALRQRDLLSPSDELYAKGLVAVNGAEALESLRRAADHGNRRGRHHRAHATLAAELLCQGYLDEARKQVDFLLLAFPDDPLCTLLDALLLLMVGDKAGASNRIARLEPVLGRERTERLKEFVGTFADLLNILEGFDAVGGLSPLESLKLASKTMRLAQVAGTATQPLGFPVPAVGRLFRMWEVVPPTIWDFLLGRSEAAIVRLTLAEREHPEGLLLFFRSAFRLRLIADYYKKGDKEKLRPALEAMVEDTNKALASPTLVPRMSFRYQCRFLAVAGDAALIQDFHDHNPERLRRMYDGLGDLVIEGRSFPGLREKLLAQLAMGLDNNAATLLVTVWQNDERHGQKPAFWTATRQRARLELKARNFTAALQAAEEVLGKFPHDKEMRKIAAVARAGMRKLLTPLPLSQP